MKNNLLPNVPEESVIVMDNEPYYYVLTENIPTKYYIKHHMMGEGGVSTRRVIVRTTKKRISRGSAEY